MKMHRLFPLVFLFLGCSVLTAQGPGIPPVNVVASSMEIKTPSQGQNGGTVTVPVILTLGTVDKAVSGFSLKIEYYDKVGFGISGQITATIPPYTSPTPGNSVIVNCTYTPQSGRKHKHSGDMTYTTGNPPNNQITPANTVFFNAK
jgi:hypothetical protein